MRVLFFRELAVVGRRPGLIWAAVVHVSVLVLFLLGWGDGFGVPLWPDVSFYRQLRLVQLACLACVLPWTALRCMAEERGDRLVLLSALTGLAPSRLIAARTLAVLGGLACVTASGVPVGILAHRISADPGRLFVEDIAVLIAFSALAAVIATWAQRLSTRPVPAWLCSAAILAAALGLVERMSASAAATAAVFALTAIAGLAALMVVADASGRQLSEVTA